MRTVILNIAGDDLMVVEVAEKKVVIAEGRLVAIANVLRGLRWDVHLHNEKHSVINTFYDIDDRYYVIIYDCRCRKIKTFNSVPEFYKVEFFDFLPCLVSMRKKGRTLYMALADIGDPKTDIIDNGELELEIGGHFDRQLYRVVNNAIHPATGICLVQKRE